jgi:hypothetical protein
MGSYVTIVNDTKDIWHCKIGPDLRLLKIFTIVLTVVTGLAVLAAAGSAITVAAASAELTLTRYFVFGLSASSLATIKYMQTTIAMYTAAQKVATLLAGASIFSATFANGISRTLAKSGFQPVRAGDRLRSKKKTLSLWQHGQCVKIVIVDELSTRTEKLSMRPIFTGATAGSNRDYFIQTFINKDGTKSETFEANVERVLSTQDNDAVIVYSNGTSKMPTHL